MRDGLDKASFKFNNSCTYSGAEVSVSVVNDTDLSEYFHLPKEPSFTQEIVMNATEVFHKMTSNVVGLAFNFTMEYLGETYSTPVQMKIFSCADPFCKDCYFNASEPERGGICTACKLGYFLNHTDNSCGRNALVDTAGSSGQSLSGFSMVLGFISGSPAAMFAMMHSQ